MKTYAATTQEQSIVEIFTEMMDQIYYEGNVQDLIDSDPQKLDWELTKPVLQIELEKPVVTAPEPKKKMTMMEKILKIENLQLVIDERAKLVQTRSELDRFQISSNDFNCSMRLNDSDGNVFTTIFTPGTKKVIDFLKSSFDASIAVA